MIKISIGIFVFLFLSTMQIWAQSKPRYFTSNAILCPIDYSSLNRKKGLSDNKLNPAISITTSMSNKYIRVSEDISDSSGKALVKKGTLMQMAEMADTSFKSSIYAPVGYAFNVVQKLGNFTVIKFWEFKKNNKGEAVSQILKRDSTAFTAPIIFKNDTKVKVVPLNANIKTSSGQKNPGNMDTTPQTDLSNQEKDTMLPVDVTADFYIIKTADLETQSKEFDNKKYNISLGLLLLPVKIRAFADTSGQFDFNSGVNIGLSLAWTFSYNWQNERSHSIILYIGPSSYQGDSTKFRRRMVDYTIPIMSSSIGYIYEKSGIQLGLFMGMDFPLNSLQKTWVYRNKPWFGIGLGFSLFSIQTKPSNTIGNN